MSNVEKVGMTILKFCLQYSGTGKSHNISAVKRGLKSSV
jgi:hypothetical protein